MNIVVINLTRFGDLLQSQAGINALASGAVSGTPDNKISLVCLANFATSAEFLDNVDHVHPLPKDGFLHSLEQNWGKAAGDLLQWRSQLWEEFKPDLVCNLTPSVPGRMLARFLAGDVPVTGFGIDDLGFGTASPWGAFFHGSSQNRSVSPFNIVDLFRAVAGKSRGEEGDSRLLLPQAGERIDSILSEILARTDGATGFIAFQPGASEERRRWPVEYFARLGDAIWREHKLVPLLLGSKDEEKLALEYSSLAQSPYFSLSGQTSLRELAATLNKCRLLVSNDTGTMHLAAGLGCPVAGIFLSTAQCWDTGPYQANSCSLEPGLACHPCSFGARCPDNFRCRYAIPPQTLVTLCNEFLASGIWPATVNSPAQWPENIAGHSFDVADEKPRVWLAERDSFGFMDLKSLSGHDNEPRTLWFREQRSFLRQFLDRDPNQPFIYTEPPEQFIFPPAGRAKLAAELGLLHSQLTILAELGKMLQQKPLPMLTERFIAALHKVSASFKNSGYMMGLGLLWQVEVQEHGEALEKAMLCINQYHSLVSSLFQRINK